MLVCLVGEVLDEHTDKHDDVAVSEFRLFDLGLGLLYVKNLVYQSQHFLAMLYDHFSDSFGFIGVGSPSFEQLLASAHDYCQRGLYFVGDVSQEV